MEILTTICFGGRGSGAAAVYFASVVRGMAAAR